MHFKCVLVGTLHWSLYDLASCFLKNKQNNKQNQTMKRRKKKNLNIKFFPALCQSNAHVFCCHMQSCSFLETTTKIIKKTTHTTTVLRGWNGARDPRPVHDTSPAALNAYYRARWRVATALIVFLWVGSVNRRRLEDERSCSTFVRSTIPTPSHSPRSHSVLSCPSASLHHC